MPRYFAYGSNMSTRRLQGRVSAEPRGVASLERHALRFHKQSTDGSGKAGAQFTGDAHDIVHGVLFELSEADHIGVMRSLVAEHCGLLLIPGSGNPLVIDSSGHQVFSKSWNSEGAVWAPRPRR